MQNRGYKKREIHREQNRTEYTAAIGRNHTGCHFQSRGGSLGAADRRGSERDSLATDEAQMGKLLQPRAIDF